jgi:hypothetical protein
MLLHLAQAVAVVAGSVVLVLVVAEAVIQA